MDNLFSILSLFFTVAFAIVTLFGVVFWIIMGYHFYKFSPSWSLYKYTVPLLFLVGLVILTGAGAFIITTF